MQLVFEALIEQEAPPSGSGWAPYEQTEHLNQPGQGEAQTIVVDRAKYTPG
jgi:hypothetical protein